MPLMLFRSFYTEEVKSRLRKIYRTRNFFRDSDDEARADASDSNNSITADDDTRKKTSGKKRSVSSTRKKPSVVPSEPVGKVGYPSPSAGKQDTKATRPSPSAGKQNTKATRAKRRRIYNLKQKKKKRLETKTYIY